VGKGILRRRPHDALILGMTHATWSSQAPSGQIWESILELGYRIALGDNASLQPNLQFILNPDGISEVPDALAIGVQMTLLF
jgi:porin